MLEVLYSFLLGLIQGLTEFLPISSTGHLYLGRKLFGLEEAGLFLDTMLHFGTLLAVIIAFWEDILSIIRRPFQRLTLLIVVGTIPTGIIGLAFRDTFEHLAQTGVTIGWEFLATALIIWWADRARNGTRDLSQMRMRDALLIGTAQGVAILPAISRSGITIAASLFVGIERETAARFSFLLSLPAILAATILQLMDLVEGTTPSVISLPAVLIGTASAAIFGYVAIRWMIRIVVRGTLKWFALYVAALGILILVLQALGIF